MTIKDIAKAANVSYATVSRALSRSPEIGADTRERILKLCDEMGYTANYVARSMVMKKTYLIGLVVHNIDNPFMSEIAYYTELSAREHGYNLMLCNSAPDLKQEEKVVELLIGRQVDGIIIIPQGPDTYANIQKYTARVPTVFVSESLKSVQESYVAVDNSLGTSLGMDYLYSLGHRDILYFGCRRNSTTHQLRVEGYYSSCQRLGLKPNVLNSDYSRSSIDHGRELAEKLFAAPRSYTAVFASTDSNALGVLKAADEAGIRVPEDLSLMGFDNIPDAGLPRIDLTTVEQPKREMAVAAVDMLLEKMDTAVSGYTHRILTPRLIVRNSCAELHRGKRKKAGA